MNVLFCYSRVPSFTNAVRDYVGAFGRHSRHAIQYFDMDGGVIDFDLSAFDAIIFNYCFWGRCLALNETSLRRIAKFGGAKIAIFQDEYDYYLWHRQNVIAMGIDTIVTGVPEKHWRDVYGGLADTVSLINALTGYVPESLLNPPVPIPLDQRSYAVGYRGREVPFAFGRLTQEKVIIGRRMKQACAERGILSNIEIGEEHRIYGAAWPEFIRNCRTVLGTESGSNVFDFSGTVKPAVAAYVAANPDADFEDVHAMFLAEIDGKIEMNQVSPRIFEAFGLGTGLVLFEGDYSGLVQPWTHYIPLRKDFSNLDEVFDAIADTNGLQMMIDRAYADLIENPTFHFSSHVARLDKHIEQSVQTKSKRVPIFGLLGWRDDDGGLAMLQAKGLRGPTSSPLIHTDRVEDPIIEFRFHPRAAHRRLLQRYKVLLKSPKGNRLHRWLRSKRYVYPTLRQLVRLGTGRRP